MLARVFATVTCPSIRLSLRPSVTSRHCVTILFFWCQISSQNSKGSPERGLHRRVGWENFLALSVNISKTVADTAKVTIID